MDAVGFSVSAGAAAGVAGAAEVSAFFGVGSFELMPRDLAALTSIIGGGALQNVAGISR